MEIIKFELLIWVFFKSYKQFERYKEIHGPREFADFKYHITLYILKEIVCNNILL